MHPGARPLSSARGSGRWGAEPGAGAPRSRRHGRRPRELRLRHLLKCRSAGWGRRCHDDRGAGFRLKGAPRVESLDQRPLRHTCARPLRRPPEAGVLPASACPPGEPPGPVSPRGLGSDLWDSDCPSAWLHKLYSVGGPAASRAAWRLLPGCRPRRGLPGVRECGSVPPCGSVSRSPSTLLSWIPGSPSLVCFGLCVDLCSCPCL